MDLGTAIESGGSGYPEQYSITEKAWRAFDDWYGDKSYREIGFAEDFYRAVARELAGQILARADQDWSCCAQSLRDAARSISPDREE